MQEKTNRIDDRRLILIVEDEAVNRAILGAILEKDYEVVFAENGREALHVVEDRKTLLSLILLDLIMPNMPGLEVLRRIRANEEYQGHPRDRGLRRPVPGDRIHHSTTVRH